jgi:hypothetical protein
VDIRVERVEEVATLYLLRQSHERKPAGYRDENDCWWPADEERRDCCQTYDDKDDRTPGTVKVPNPGPARLPADPVERKRYLAIREHASESLRRHCCSLKHVANLLYLSDDERKAARARTREIRKGVAIKDWKWGPDPSQLGERARETVKVISW